MKKIAFIILSLPILLVQKPLLANPTFRPGYFEAAEAYVSSLLLTEVDSEPDPVTLHPEFGLEQADCSGFITPEGRLGPKGLTIKTALKSYPHLSSLLNPPRDLLGVTEICPRFYEMNPEELEKFYIWLFTAIAWGESRCVANRINPRASNSENAGPAVGLLQLEDLLRARSWRGPLCRATSVRAPRENLHCGLEILRGHFENVYGRTGKGLIVPNSYWQVLRRPRFRVPQLIQLFPGCQRPAPVPSAYLAPPHLDAAC
jgi:hypothetical protein